MTRSPIVALVGLCACGAPEPPPSTGGGTLPLGRCGRGTLVVQSDYQSTNLSLLDAAGEVVSSSFLSSGSADAGLTAALSGDVVAPTSRVAGAEAVLIDRYPASVVTWVDLETASVRAQLDVRTGFASNPQDYLALDENKAYLSRYESNPAPGGEAFDGGGDLLVVDPSAPAIVGRVDLHGVVPSEVLPRANRMVSLGDHVVVLLSAYSADFATAAASQLALVDPATDAVVDVLALDGLEGCAGLAVEPAWTTEGDPVTSPRLAVACSGSFGGDGAADLATSGVALVQLAGGALEETARFPASDLTARPLGFTAAFADPEHLLVVAVGRFDGSGEDEPDTLLSLRLADGSTEPLLETPTRPFELGEVRCLGPVQPAGDAAGCERCWVADAERGVIHPLRVDGAIHLGEPVVVDDSIGLPPRTIGAL